MLYELRRYVIHVEHLSAFLQLAPEGLAIESSHLGTPICYLQELIGVPNRVTHLWSYPTFVERTTRRQRLYSDATWIAYVQRVAPWIQSMETSLLTDLEPHVGEPLKSPS